MNERAATMMGYEKPWAYVVLTKPDVTFLVVMTTVAGFYLGSTGAMNWALLLNTVLATMLVAGGTAALNQLIEREMDAVMRRTAARPLPTGVLQPRDVLIFGVVTIVAGARVARDCRESCSRALWRWRLRCCTSDCTRRSRRARRSRLPSARFPARCRR